MRPMARTCAFIAAAVAFSSVARSDVTQESEQNRAITYQKWAIYLDRETGDTGVSFGDRIGIGTIENSPGLDPLRMQEWSEPARNCSDRDYLCVSAGNFLIFVPVAQPGVGRVYRHRGFELRTLRCDASSDICLMAVNAASSDNANLREAPSPSSRIYFIYGRSGIQSLGFGDFSPNPSTASRQFRLVGRLGLFGRVSPAGNRTS
jgi:hypothetical protein